MKKILVDVNYFYFKLNSISSILKKTQSSRLYLNFLPEQIQPKAIYRTTFSEGDNERLIFFKGILPFKLLPAIRFHQKIRKLNPDFVLIHGLGYSFNAVFLRFILPKKAIIAIQVHGYAPIPKGLKKIIYQWSQKRINAFLFTGKTNAQPWIDQGIFHPNKVFEVMEGATLFKHNINVKPRPKSFLWVGRLNDNKDPITVVKAFSQFLKTEPAAKLTMIYHTEELLLSIKAFISKNEQLIQALTLKGKLPHKKMEYIYQSHQFFVLGSHYEGSGYALHEAMACGCIPVVTDIAPFMFMTNNGDCAILFSPSNQNSCVEALIKTQKIEISTYRKKVLAQVENRLSPKAIANDILTMFQDLLEKKQL